MPPRWQRRAARFRSAWRRPLPDDDARITLVYPWVRGESYEVELLMSPGGAVEYEIEDAEAGSRSAESA